MDKTYLRNFFALCAAALASLLLILYILYHMFGTDSGVIQLAATSVKTARETVSAEAYIMRQEEILYSQSFGSMKYLYGNGTKVGNGANVAEVYEGTSIYEQIVALENRISVLQQSNAEKGMAMADTTMVDGNISAMYYSILGKVRDGDLDSALYKRDNFLVLLNRRRIIAKSVANYDDKIEELEQQRDALLQTVTEVTEYVSAPTPGYFYADLDGYEQVFSSSQVDSMDLDRFDLMVDSEPNQSIYSSSKGYAVGKLVTDYNWYLACAVTRDEYREFVNSAQFDVIFPYNGDYELSMKLYRVVNPVESDRVLLIFSAGVLPEDFNYLRKQTVDIVINSHTGYEIPVSAVSMENGQAGVYVLQGSVVHFRTIKPLFEKDGNLIVQEKDAAGDTSGQESLYAPLGLNEFVIVKGKNLYDGKTIS